MNTVVSDSPLSHIPSRRYTPHGKIRDITKPESEAFNSALCAIMEPYPFTDDFNGGWNIQTDYGVLCVHKPYGPQSLYYCINMAFRGSREELAEAVRRFGDHALNPFSGKWNILEVEGDDALDVFKTRLESVNARP